MAVEKGKVKAALDAKYKGTSLTKELKEGYAEVYADLIENEEGIEAFLNTQDAMIRLNMKDADRRSQAAAAKARQDAADAAAGKTEPDVTPEPQPDPNMPEWAKALIEQNKAMQTQIAGFQAAQQTKSISERFNSDERVKNIPEFIRAGYMPANQDEYESKVEALATGYAAFAEQNKLASIGGDTPPAGGKPSGRAVDVKPASDEEVKAIAAML